MVKENCSNLSEYQKHKLLRLLLDYEELFDGTLGDFQEDPVKFNLQLGEKTYHRRSYPIPHSQLKQFKKEVDRLEEIGVIKKIESEWGSPTFSIPKLEQTLRFLGDFREVNKQLIRNIFSLPKNTDILQGL